MDGSQSSVFLEERRNRLLVLLNKLVAQPGGEDMYWHSRPTMLVIPSEEALALEKEFPELGLKKLSEENYAVTIASLLATVTDVLCGRRLAFQLHDPEDGSDPRDNDTVGFQWWTPGKEEN